MHSDNRVQRWRSIKNNNKNNNTCILTKSGVNTCVCHVKRVGKLLSNIHDPHIYDNKPRFGDGIKIASNRISCIRFCQFGMQSIASNPFDRSVWSERASSFKASNAPSFDISFFGIDMECDIWHFQMTRRLERVLRVSFLVCFESPYLLFTYAKKCHDKR